MEARLGLRATPLFVQAKDMGITLLTISHHESVDKHHSRAIDLHVGGTCTIGG